jgi:hypothetical protein
MEQSGDQKYRRYADRDLGIWDHIFKVDNRTGVDYSRDVATDTGEQAVAVLVGYFLANHHVGHSCHHEECHQEDCSPPQATVFSPTTYHKFNINNK